MGTYKSKDRRMMQKYLKPDQSIIGLQAAYRQVYGKTLYLRVRNLCDNYTAAELTRLTWELDHRADQRTQIVPCFWTLTQLADFYKIKPKVDPDQKVT